MQELAVLADSRQRVNIVLKSVIVLEHDHLEFDIGHAWLLIFQRRRAPLHTRWVIVLEV